MLWTIISLLFSSYVVRSTDLTCSTFGQTPLVNTGNNNYVVDTFGGILFFAYAFDQCTALDVVPTTKYATYHCDWDSVNETWSVTKSVYGTNVCSGKPTTTVITAGAEEGYPGDFNCDGDNTYARVEISIFDDCSHSQTIYAALGTCLYNSPLQTQFYCDSSTGLVQFFLNETEFLTINNLTESTSEAPFEGCDSMLYCNKWSFSQSCGTVGVVQGVAIYGKLDACMDTAATTTTASPTSSAPVVTFSWLAIIFSAVLLFVAC